MKLRPLNYHSNFSPWRNANGDFKSDINFTNPSKALKKFSKLTKNSLIFSKKLLVLITTQWMPFKPNIHKSFKANVEFSKRQVYKNTNEYKKRKTWFNCRRRDPVQSTGSLDASDEEYINRLKEGEKFIK